MIGRALVQPGAAKRETVAAENRPTDDAPRPGITVAAAVIDARKLARQVVDEINRALTVITGNVRMIELEAPQLPPAVAGHLQAVIDEARRITLISHKLSRLDRLLAGGTEEPESQPHDTCSRSMGDGSC
jgi:hypothetical protein